MKVFRVTRVDKHKGFYHQPLTKVVTERALNALIKDHVNYGRYKIIKIEESEIDWRDVTNERLGDHKAKGE